MTKRTVSPAWRLLVAVVIVALALAAGAAFAGEHEKACVSYKVGQNGDRHYACAPMQAGPVLCAFYVAQIECS